MSKGDILAAISTLSEAIGFCQYEYNACHSAGLKATIDGLVKVRGQLQSMLQEQDKLRRALDEIGTTAASVLDEEDIRTWDDGGRLGDALIGIKDIVATFNIEEKLEEGAGDE